MAKAKTKGGESEKLNRKQTKIPDLPISSVYLYHIVNGDPCRKYEVVYRNKVVYDSGYTDADVKRILRETIENAILSNVPPYYCEGEDLMYMRRKSLVVFVVESDTILSQSGDMTFQSYKGNNGYHTFDRNRRRYFKFNKNNRTFYVSYCLNIMKSTDGEDLALLDYERFWIDLPYQKRGKRDREPGTGGTNMGPPLGPPDRKRKKR